MDLRLFLWLADTVDYLGLDFDDDILGLFRKDVSPELLTSGISEQNLRRDKLENSLTLGMRVVIERKLYSANATEDICSDPDALEPMRSWSAN